MFLADYHNHTHLSPDGFPHADYISMAKAAVEAGLSELCITEHCECNGFYLSIDNNIGFTYDREACRAELLEAREALGSRISLPFGVEIGQPTEVPEKAELVLDHEDYDFIIGSLHNIRGEADFSLLDYPSADVCREMLSRYVRELYELAESSVFDVIGHVDYPLRYMRRKFDVDLCPHEEELRALFTLLRERGKGIEINTKVLRGDSPIYTQQDYILRLFREQGGEILTLGSDAHKPEDVGAGLRESAELALSQGLDRVATFRRHEPTLHSLR
ncbi:MAG: histidinol-phosphatase HisJ family protein [Clostridia bacterium]|nr:histidinol-phosphatase HisJ family protein [Clostridia bacterium]